MTSKNENVIQFPESGKGEFQKMYMVTLGHPQSEDSHTEYYDTLAEAFSCIQYNIELDDIGTNFSIECFMGRHLTPIPKSNLAKNITRENVNSLEVPAEQVFEYVRQLFLRGEVLTQVEFIILAFMADNNPTIKEMVEGKEANITNTKHFPPEFSEAMEKYKAMLDANNGVETDEARAQFAKVIMLAPDWFNDMAMAEIDKMNLLPKPTHYTDNGEPVFSVEQIAKHLGVTIEDAQKSLDMLIDKRTELGLETPLVDPTTINKIQ
ncbi:helix-turn-helix domain-containing protein [Acinetobacter higginsii]|uniref:helix-turn-helix domain-containing protein n=1 Tax=Acinetobacter higginsii TaxID=70347 RepID=UPI001F4AB241|nr:helix-turn-helix domain-containing protein [Acinetobacter higginsii]MCH7380651.1 helix-turn-helix domain-containing protein [Acinetobacter higginsii]